MSGDGKRIRMRYPGTCRGCAARLAAGEAAVYFRRQQTVRCLRCVTQCEHAKSPGALAFAGRAVAARWAMPQRRARYVVRGAEH